MLLFSHMSPEIKIHGTLEAEKEGTKATYHSEQDRVSIRVTVTRPCISSLQSNRSFSGGEANVICPPVFLNAEVKSIMGAVVVMSLAYSLPRT